MVGICRFRIQALLLLPFPFIVQRACSKESEWEKRKVWSQEVQDIGWNCWRNACSCTLSSFTINFEPISILSRKTTVHQLRTMGSRADLWKKPMMCIVYWYRFLNWYKLPNHRHNLWQELDPPLLLSALYPIVFTNTSSSCRQCFENNGPVKLRAGRKNTLAWWKL